MGPVFCGFLLVLIQLKFKMRVSSLGLQALEAKISRCSQEIHCATIKPKVYSVINVSCTCWEQILPADQSHCQRAD